MGNEVPKEGNYPVPRPKDDSSSSPRIPISCTDAAIATKLPGLSDSKMDANNNQMNNNMNNQQMNNQMNHQMNHQHMNNQHMNNQHMKQHNNQQMNSNNVSSNDSVPMTPYLVYMREYNRVLFEQMMEAQKNNKGYGSNMDQFAAFAQYKVSKENHVKDIEKSFKPKKQLGFGASCKVYLAEHIETKHLYAVKSMIRRDKYNPKLFLRELTILEQIRHHPGVVQLFDSYMCPTNYYIVLEFCSGGSFFDKIKKETSFSEKQTSKYIIQILDAVDYMHSKNIVHKDIKPGNMVFDKKGRKGRLRLIDFGTAEIVENEKFYPFDGVGTYTFVSPEFDRARKGWEIKKGDVWAIGIITYILICGLMPFNGRDNKDIFKKIKNYNGKLAYPANINMSKDCINFILRLLHIKVENRLTAKQAMKHPFIGGPPKRVLLEDDGGSGGGKIKTSKKIKDILSIKKKKKDDNEVVLLSHHTHKKDENDSKYIVKIQCNTMQSNHSNDQQLPPSPAPSRSGNSSPRNNSNQNRKSLLFSQLAQVMPLQQQKMLLKNNQKAHSMQNSFQFGNEQKQMHVQQQQSMMALSMFPMTKSVSDGRMVINNNMGNPMLNNMMSVNSMLNTNNMVGNARNINNMSSNSMMNNNVNVGGMQSGIGGQQLNQQQLMLMYQQQQMSQQAMYQNFQQQSLRGSPQQQQQQSPPNNFSAN